MTDQPKIPTDVENADEQSVVIETELPTRIHLDGITVGHSDWNNLEVRATGRALDAFASKVLCALIHISANRNDYHTKMQFSEDFEGVVVPLDKVFALVGEAFDGQHPDKTLVRKLGAALYALYNITFQAIYRDSDKAIDQWQTFRLLDKLDFSHKDGYVHFEVDPFISNYFFDEASMAHLIEGLWGFMDMADILRVTVTHFMAHKLDKDQNALKYLFTQDAFEPECIPVEELKTACETLRQEGLIQAFEIEPSLDIEDAQVLSINVR
ncbi:MAG: hypothetical protein Q4E62_03990 [Sutterellaceae bacterium]|nr:hypothetical protein [Sutterellaceae bacterium]